MKYGMRERVSGAVILVALGVIFIPMLFDDPAPRGERPQPVLTIEQPIAVERREVAEPQPPASLGQLPLAAGGSEGEEAEAASSGETAPAVDPIAELAQAAEQRPAPQPTPAPQPARPAPAPAPAPAAPATPSGDWAVQVGSFGERGNAERLEAQLREQGFNVFSRPRNNLTTVYVGPFETSEAGERAMNELKSRANLQGLLVRGRH